MYTCLRRNRSRGFTIAEVLVTVAIIGVLAAVAVPSIQEMRKKSRDTERVSELAQLQLALRMYKDAIGGYPDFDAGVVVGEGGALDALLAPYLPEIPNDPRGPSDNTYEYFYDSEMRCRTDNTNHVVLFARTAEQTAQQNWVAVCNSPGAGSSGNDTVHGNPSASSYGLILQ